MKLLLGLLGVLSVGGAFVGTRLYGPVVIRNSGGSEVASISDTGVVLTGSGTAPLPARAYEGDTDSGDYRVGANHLGLSVAGAKLVDYSTTGVLVTGASSSLLGVGASGNAGTLKFYPSTASKGSTSFTMSDNSGDTLTNINVAAQAGAVTYTVPDAGGSASFVMTAGAQTLAGVKTFSSAPVLTAGGTSNGALTTTDGVGSGTARKVGGLAYASTAASTAVTGTASETPFDTNYNMPANTLKAGTVLRIRYQGIITGHNGSDTMTIKLKIGGTTSDANGTALVTTSAVNDSANDIFTGEFYITARAAPGATAACVGWGNYSDPAAAGAASKNAYIASTNLATNGALPIKVTCTFSGASGTNSARLDYMTVEALG